MSKNESSYRVDLHILDHAETIYNSLGQYNPLKHKAHFKCSIDTSQLIANGFNSKDKINNVMKLMFYQKNKFLHQLNVQNESLLQGYIEDIYEDKFIIKYLDNIEGSHILDLNEVQDFIFYKTKKKLESVIY